MPDQPDLPALSDDDLRETLDLMATAVASMSDRIDDLTALADKQIKVATEARIAAFAARDQTNPKKYGDLLGQTSTATWRNRRRDDRDCQTPWRPDGQDHRSLGQIGR